MSSMIRAKSCTVCGKRTPDGASRCSAHKTGGARPRSCVVCGRQTQGNYCDLHEPVIDEQTRDARNPYRKAYKSEEYARNRRLKFDRSGGRCELCKVECQPGDWQCDHVVPLSKGGTNDLSNLRILCTSCHQRVTRASRASR
jgi:5-methylcytosine-specific restriction protein A